MNVTVNEEEATDRSSAGRNEESITFSAEPNRGQLMCRLFVPLGLFFFPLRGAVLS